MSCIEISSGGSDRESYVIVPSFTFEVCCSFGVGSEILDGKDGKIIRVTHMMMLQTRTRTFGFAQIVKLDSTFLAWARTSNMFLGSLESRSFLLDWRGYT